MKGSIIKTSIYLLLLGGLFSTSLFSQSMVKSKLSYNPVLNSDKKKKLAASTFRSAAIADTVVLGVKGIIDDFSYAGPYPDTSLWLDAQVYVNRGFAVSPMSVGVATFDGLGADGYPYNFLATTAALPADTLTSKPIDLNYPASDSVYFSFYYQPQGLGNDPQTDDSLVLEFKAPGNNPWEHIWSKQGFALTASDTGFNLVMIPIVNPLFLKKGFQFRFRNYATISANADQWNIDYVYLNTIRKVTDTVFQDVAWVYEGTPLLKNYTAMPWKQYSSSEIRTNTGNLMRNNDIVLRSINYHYQTLNLTAASVLDQFNGSSNINPFLTNKIYTDCDVPQGCINTVSIDASKFPASLTGPAKLAIKHYYSSNQFGDFIPKNDTLLVVGDFSNYFAYDDGTAEGEAGLVNALNGQLAVQFKLNVADTLGAVDIYFNPFMDNAELYGFYLNVWSDNSGKPGTVIYTSPSVLSPVYEKKGNNFFSRYYLNSPPILSAGTYYVGFTQKTTESLNVGLDLNNNSQNSTFVNLANGTGWKTSTIAGSLMMRPVTGNVVNPVGIEEYNVFSSYLQIYPNPVSTVLYIKSTTVNDIINYQITDVFGKTVVDGNNIHSKEIDVSDLSEGLYFIRVTSGTEVATNKFIKIN